MDTYFDMISWWQLPLSAIGNELTAVISVGISTLLMFGLFAFILKVL